ncbi:hypothetical protein BFP97_17920 [Roseivirga sp. 4D4]|uniref:hypothetical protein n=1 Tax=Roseivirga sp. 4D4 TaxID=1889784 RepID=UPI000853244C|nr:hypothetical protein [Roseivirga sp. 4D4]OEK03288.1 hypothetical protein BFP97_17920 [Roseivirga sp. 4D4]
MKSLKDSIITFSLVVLGITLYVTTFATNTIVFEKDLQKKAIDLFTNLGALWIIVERSLIVYTGIWRRKDKVQLKQDLASAEESLTTAKDGLQNTVAGISQSTVTAAVNDRDGAKKKLEVFRAETGVITLRTSLIIGIIVAAVGFRILESLFNSDGLNGFQQTLFHMVDILLTAGILAGGSSMIHSLTSTLENFFENSKK